MVVNTTRVIPINVGMRIRVRRMRKFLTGWSPDGKKEFPPLSCTFRAFCSLWGGFFNKYYNSVFWSSSKSKKKEGKKSLYTKGKRKLKYLIVVERKKQISGK